MRPVVYRLWSAYEPRSYLKEAICYAGVAFWALAFGIQPVWAEDDKLILNKQEISDVTEQALSIFDWLDKQLGEAIKYSDEHNPEMSETLSITDKLNACDELDGVCKEVSQKTRKKSGTQVNFSPYDRGRNLHRIFPLDLRPKYSQRKIYINRHPRLLIRELSKPVSKKLKKPWVPKNKSGLDYTEEDINKENGLEP